MNIILNLGMMEIYDNGLNRREDEMRELKFRAWDKYSDSHPQGMSYDVNPKCDADVIMQYTGLKDKNGVEIYEFMEINNKYEVIFYDLKYVLKDISNGDIMPLENKGDLYEITREYTKI